VCRKYKWKEKLSVTVFILPFLALIFLVLGTIWGGIATPTEGAALGAAGALALPLSYGKLRNWAALKMILVTAARINCMVMFILVGAALFTQVLAYVGFTTKLVQTIVSLPVPTWSILFFMMLGIFCLGCIMDAPSILFLTMPIYLPIASSLGFDLIWFGILALLNLEIATITPPVGLNLYVMKGIAPDVSAKDIIRGVAPYWGIDAVALFVVALFPPLVTWLPNTLLGIS
jgi:tripartite ATP-independent transporter DctM subunit